MVKDRVLRDIGAKAPLDRTVCDPIHLIGCTPLSRVCTRSPGRIVSIRRSPTGVRMPVPLVK